MNTAEQSLSMKEVKLKLANLKELMPQSNDTIWKLGIFLSEYLNEELTPSGFVFGTELAIHDLQKGVNGFTNQKISNSLVGYPGIMYNLMRIAVPEIAGAVLPIEFAVEVKKVIKDAKE